MMHSIWVRLVKRNLSRVAAVLTFAISPLAQAQQQQPLFITMGGWTYRHDKAGQPAFAAFPGFTGPIATAVSSDGKKFYSARNAGRLVVQWHRIRDDGNIDGPAAARYKEFGQNPGYLGFYTLTANATGVYVSDAPGWGGGNSYRLDSDTLEIVEEFKGGYASGVSVAGVVQPITTINKGPFTFGNTNKWVYLAFEDESIPYSDREWIAREFAAQTERWGIPLRVSTGRPPQAARLTPGLYGTVRILPATQWPYSMAGVVWKLGNWQVTAPSHEEDKVAWQIGYQQGRGKEGVLFTALHEGIGHSLGGLHDLHGGLNGSLGPAGNLMSVPQYSDWRQCINLTPAQLQSVRDGYARWSWSKVHD